jgi:cation-transporting ATPase I
VGLPGPGRLTRLAAGTALHVTATGVGLAAALATPPVRQARAAAGSATRTATVVATAGARTVDDATGGGLQRLVEAGRAMFEPPDARRSRRVWVSRGHAHLELATPAVRRPPRARPGPGPPAGSPVRAAGPGRWDWPP